MPNAILQTSLVILAGLGTIGKKKKNEKKGKMDYEIESTGCAKRKKKNQHERGKNACAFSTQMCKTKILPK